MASIKASVGGFLKGRWPFLLIWLLTVLAGMALWLLDPLPMQTMRHAQFDQFQRWHPRSYEPVPVRVVDIDEASLKALGQWPWPRTKVAELLQKLTDDGAAAIAMDILLAEPDRTSPHAMSRVWGDAVPGLSALLSQLPDHDLALAETLKKTPTILGLTLSQVSAGDAAVHPTMDDKAQPPYRIVATGASSPTQWLHRFNHEVGPLAELASAAPGLGALNFVTDGDGIVRRVPLFTQWQSAPGAPGQPVPSLSAEALRVAQGASNHLLRTSEAGMQDVRIGQLTIPTNHRGEMWLHYTLAEPSRYVSAVDVLQGKVPREQLEGNIVILGTSAAGLMDLRFNPMGRLMPGVEAHAQALEQVLLGHYLERPAWASGVEAGALVLGALAAGLVALLAPAWASAAFTLVLLGGLLGGAWYLFTAQRILLDVASPTLAVLASFGLTSGIHHFISERQQRWVKEAFSRYVSPNRVAYLVDHPEQLQLGGKRQTCSFVFTDLAGFTTLMENGDPAEAVRLLNEYLDGMVSIAFAHEATLDRIVGDAVVLLFSAPVPQPDHRQRALNCALAMDAFATQYAAKVNADGVAWGHTRIGVHSGEVIVGNFGGKTVFDYRALGDPINTAARLESVNKHFGTRMCVSQQILDGCTDAAIRPVGRLVLKGKSRAIHVFEPLQTTDAAACAQPEAYQAAFNLLLPGDQQNPAGALLAFEALGEQFPEDPLVQLHLRQLRAGGTDDLIVMADK